jgi:hypothetical protein
LATSFCAEATFFSGRGFLAALGGAFLGLEEFFEGFPEGFREGEILEVFFNGSRVKMPTARARKDR